MQVEVPVGINTPAGKNKEKHNIKMLVHIIISIIFFSFCLFLLWRIYAFNSDKCKLKAPRKIVRFKTGSYMPLVKNGFWGGWRGLESKGGLDYDVATLEESWERFNTEEMAREALNYFKHSMARNIDSKIYEDVYVENNSCFDEERAEELIKKVNELLKERDRYEKKV